MTCGCQKRKLANGKAGCSKCASNPPVQKTTTANTAPTVNAVSIDPFK